MSHRLIAHSPDLLELRNQGYHLEIRNGYLLIKEVPYVTSKAEVRYDGILVSKLETEVRDGVEVTKTPEDHVARWIGEHPSHADGRKIRSFENGSEPQDLGGGLKVDFTFSAKAAYRDYGHKMLAYIGWIEGEAQKLDPKADARTHPVYPTDPEDDDLFQYIDTASSRVNIGADNEKLEQEKIAIIGVGGTGSYVLDLVAKTRVAEIHIFDDDRFDTHNAFRSPGAWSLAELEQKKSKVQNLLDIYGKLRRRGLSGERVKLSADNLHLLDGITFAFLCLDQGRAKRAIVDWLLAHNVPFIEVGMGIIRTPEGLQGLLRTVTGTPEKNDHLNARISFGEDDEPDEAENNYATNIQIAELNALNAAFAVIRWKRLRGFYRDSLHEHYSSYRIASNEVANEEKV